MGHHIVPPVPSLFTFNVPHSPLLELAGVSVPKADVRILGTDLKQSGPLLITHWGFSGPAILKLSAWGARILHDMQYEATLIVNWLPDITRRSLVDMLNTFKAQNPAKLVVSECPVPLPKNLWKKLLQITRNTIRVTLVLFF